MVEAIEQLNLEVLDLYTRLRKVKESKLPKVPKSMEQDVLFQAGMLCGELRVIEEILTRVQQLQSQT